MSDPRYSSEFKAGLLRASMGIIMRTATRRVVSALALILALATMTSISARQPRPNDPRSHDPRPLPDLVNVDRLAPRVPAPAKTPADSLYLLGGPGVLSGKFQDEAGLPDRQGWEGVDLNVPAASHWQVSSFNAAGLDPGTPDNHAWWCGALFEPCDDEDPAEGYGSSWIDFLDWYGSVSDPDSNVTVRIQAVISYDIEPGEDYLYLRVDNSEWMEELRSFTYTSAAAETVDVSATLTPDYYVGPSGDQVHLRWAFSSDGAWDDSDCLWSTAGAAQIDLIQVHFDQGGGPVQVGVTETCEAGDPLQWQPTLPRGPGDFSKVWPELDDADPAADNDTPQFAFIDDGVVVPGTGGFPCTTYCYGPGGYIVNPQTGLSEIYDLIDNEVRSPILQVPGGGWTGAVFSFDQYVHAEFDNGGAYVVGLWHVRSTADPDGLTGWSEWRDRNLVIWGEARYVREIQNVGDLLVPGFTHVQLALGVRNYYSFSTDGTPAPYFDNVSFKVYRDPGPSVLLVRADGSGDYATIQAAINAAAVGDTVLLADGVFTGDGNRDLNFTGKEIIVCSQSGDPERCILDVQGAPEDNHRGFDFTHEEGPGSVISGLTITGGYQDRTRSGFYYSGGGVVCRSGSSPTIDKCIFRGNSAVGADQQGGAVFCDDASPVIRDCVFTGNTAVHGGAVAAIEVSNPVIENCLFVGNEALSYGGGIYSYESTVHFTIRSCTFHGNTNAANSGTLFSRMGGQINVDRSILAFGNGYAATATDAADISFSCCDIYGNARGDWQGDFAEQLGVDGNINLDPLFCLLSNPARPFRIHEDSPCAPAFNPDCGMVGYHSVGCGSPSAAGDLPADSRGSRLFPCSPNPFNPRTTVSFFVDRSQHVRVAVYDLAGRRLAVLVDREVGAGTHTVPWEGRTSAGEAAASGTYFLRLESAGAVQTEKVCLIR